MKTSMKMFALLVAVPLMFGVGCKKEDAGQAAPAETPAVPAEDTAAAPSNTEAKLAVAQEAEAGCALCIYQMDGVNTCRLAVKIDDKPHLVTGVAMDSLGDAHAEDGLCNVARTVYIDGHKDGDQIVATTVEFVPEE